MVILTIDTDWAPDWATAEILNRIKALGIKTTVFFSTPSPVGFWPELEIGCHPDLSKESGDQRPEKEIVADYRASFPEAKAFRTHRFYWHSDLPRNLLAQGFTLDSSLILPYHPDLRPFKVGRLKRFPVWASDHLHLARGLSCRALEFPNWSAAGLKVFCFHVAYLCLNAGSLRDFNMIDSEFNQETMEKRRADKAGVWNLFEMLAEYIYKTSSGAWLAEIPESYFVGSD